MDTIAQVIHKCETHVAVKQGKRVNLLWYAGQWLKCKYGEAWQIDYITLPKTHQGKSHVLTMVEAATGWLETYTAPYATAQNTIPGLENDGTYEDMAPQKELSQTMGVISETIS